MTYSPDAVAFPDNSGQVSQLFHLANKKLFPIIPRGAGSGMSGGALPVYGGLVIAMDRFNQILSIDQDNLVAKVEPAVITAHFQREVEKIGLFYPPDPASLNISTLGGNVAECAGGLRAVKYGVTRDYILGLEIVLPTGEILETGVETMKGVAGYDLTRLIIGSEGTLAVITSITLRLVPKPESKATMIAFFPDVNSAARAVSSMIQRKNIPSILEFMDRQCLECVKDELDISVPSTAAAMLLIEVDGDVHQVNRDSEKIRLVCEQQGVIRFEIAHGEKQVEKLWAARREVSPSLLKLRPHKINEDVVVPRSRLPELVEYLEKESRECGLPIPAFGHAGDGNIHVNIMLDKDIEKEIEIAERLVERIFRKVLQMGGTITGEHGIGITKARYLELEIPKPGLSLMARIKKAFDPNNILNPGKIFMQDPT
jgi:glycolate oxidase